MATLDSKNHQITRLEYTKKLVDVFTKAQTIL